MDGTAINFTVVSNYKNLDFGITACRKSMPHVQRLIDYMDDSLVELEDAAGISSTGKAQAKAKAKRKVAAKSDAKPKSKVKARPKDESVAKPDAGSGPVDSGESEATASS
jgi:diacylglycerol O-acyltransferase